MLLLSTKPTAQKHELTRMMQLLLASAKTTATVCHAVVNVVAKVQQESTKLLGKAQHFVQKSKAKAEKEM